MSKTLGSRSHWPFFGNWFDLSESLSAQPHHLIGHALHLLRQVFQLVLGPGQLVKCLTERLKKHCSSGYRTSNSAKVSPKFIALDSHTCFSPLIEVQVAALLRRLNQQYAAASTARLLAAQNLVRLHLQMLCSRESSLVL